MKLKSTILVTAAVLTLVFALSDFPAMAQGKDKPADTMQILRDKVKADKKLFMAENMQLTESEAKAFWPVYESYQNDLMKFNEKVTAMIKSYAGNYQTMTNASAKQLLDTYLDLEMERVNFSKSYLPKLRAVLPDVKVARFIQLENKIQAAVSFDAALQIPLVK
jgi:hypothetical protein